jgi:hypothetical protein
MKYIAEVTYRPKEFIAAQKLFDKLDLAEGVFAVKNTWSFTSQKDHDTSILKQHITQLMQEDVIDVIRITIGKME